MQPHLADGKAYGATNRAGIKFRQRSTRRNHSPVVLRNRAEAVAEIEGRKPDSTLSTTLISTGTTSSTPYADPLRRLGRDNEATQAYDAAITRTENRFEREFLQQRRQSLAAPSAVETRLPGNTG